MAHILRRGAHLRYNSMIDRRCDYMCKEVLTQILPILAAGQDHHHSSIRNNLPYLGDAGMPEPRVSFMPQLWRIRLHTRHCIVTAQCDIDADHVCDLRKDAEKIQTSREGETSSSDRGGR